MREEIFDPVRAVVAGYGGHVGAGDGCLGGVEAGRDLFSLTHLPLFREGVELFPLRQSLGNGGRRKAGRELLKSVR